MTEHTIRIIKRGGADGSKYPVSQKQLTFGTEQSCDIRVKIPTVEGVHTRLEFGQNEIKLFNLSVNNPTKVNGVPVEKECTLTDGDVFTIIDRSFRYEAAQLRENVEAEKENLATPPPKPRKSKIMFGPELTPEEFDKKLPPVAPISKGRTPPRRGSTGYSILKGIEKSKTAGVLAEAEDSPEKLVPDESTEDATPGTPVKSKERGVPAIAVNLNEERIEEAIITESSDDDTTDIVEDDNVNASMDQLDEVATVIGEAAAAAVTCTLDKSVTETDNPDCDNLNPIEALNMSSFDEPTDVHLVYNPAEPDKDTLITEDSVEEVVNQSCFSDASKLVKESRLSQGSSAFSSEDNITIYETSTEEESVLSASSSPANNKFSSTIDEFLEIDSSNINELEESQTSEIVDLETSKRISNVLPSPDVSVHDVSSHSEIIDLNKSDSEGMIGEMAVKERQSVASSNLSTESEDNIVVYNTTAEESELESDATKLDESLATEPGLNTTIDDFLKENSKFPATTPNVIATEEAVTTEEQRVKKKTPLVRRSTRKSVRFGPMLSPEQYDKDMPANTPIRKGALPGRYSVPNPQLSAGRTPLRKSVAVCASSAGMLKLDESMESLDSLDSANQDSATRAHTQRRKTMTPKEVKANLSWFEIKGETSEPAAKKEHVDSPIVTQTPKTVPKTDTLFSLEEEPVENEDSSDENAAKIQPGPVGKVFGKMPASAKTPASAKIKNPALCRPSPPTPIPFHSKALQKPQSLHMALQKAAGKKAMIEKSQVPKSAAEKRASMLGKRKSADATMHVSTKTPKKENPRKSAPVKLSAKVSKTVQETASPKKVTTPKKATTPRKITVPQKLSQTPKKTPKIQKVTKTLQKSQISPKVTTTPQKSMAPKSVTKTPSYVEEMKQKVIAKQQEVQEKRKSIQEKRKSVGPKTWASVASKLTKSPWKPAVSAGTVKLPPKTPLRERALKAMSKTRVVKKADEPLLKTGKKRKSTSLVKPVTKQTVKRKSVPTKTPRKSITKTQAMSAAPTSPLTAIIPEGALKTARGTQLIANATVTKCEEVMQDSFAENTSEVKEVSMKKVEEVLCDENQLVEVISDDMQPDAVDKLCMVMDPIVMMQYENNINFDFGSVRNILKNTESCPEIDQVALRKLFATPKKAKNEEVIDSVALMELFAHPDLLQINQKSSEIDAKAINTIFETAVKSNDIELLYKKPDDEGKIVDIDEATNVLRRSSLVMRKSLLPGDLCRLFTVDQFCADDEQSASNNDEINVENPTSKAEEEDKQIVEDPKEIHRDVDGRCETNDDDLQICDEIFESNAVTETGKSSELERGNEDDEFCADDEQSARNNDDIIVENSKSKAEEDDKQIVDETEEKNCEVDERDETHDDDLKICDKNFESDAVKETGKSSQIEGGNEDDESNQVTDPECYDFEEAANHGEDETEQTVDHDDKSYDLDLELQKKVDTLCAVLTPMVRKRWSQNRSYDFGAISGTLKLNDGDELPEIDPYAMRKMFTSPKRTSEEGILDPVSLIKLFLNPEIMTKSSETEIEVDPIALQNLFKLSKEPQTDFQMGTYSSIQPEQERQLAQSNQDELMDILKTDCDDVFEKIYKPLETESVKDVLDKAKRSSRRSTLPGDICKLFVADVTQSEPDEPGVEEIISNFTVEIKKSETISHTPRRGCRTKKQDPQEQASLQEEPTIKIKAETRGHAREDPKPEDVEEEESTIEEKAIVESKAPTKGRRAKKEPAPEVVEEPTPMQVEPAVEIKSQTRESARDAPKPEDVEEQSTMEKNAIVESKASTRERRANKAPEVVQEQASLPEEPIIKIKAQTRGLSRKDPKPEELVEEQSTMEEKAIVESKASTRGRRAKEEPATEVVEEPTPMQVEPAVEMKAQTRGHRTRKCPQPEDAEEPITLQKDSVVETKTPARGRRTRKNFEICEEPMQDESVVEINTGTRGRRAKRAPQVAEEVAENKSPKAEIIASSTPARERPVKKAKIVEDDVEPTKKPAARRGKKASKASEKLEKSSTPARGRQAKKEPDTESPNKKAKTVKNEVELEKLSPNKRKVTENSTSSKRCKKSSPEDEFAELKKVLQTLEEEDANLSMTEAALDDIIAKSPAAKKTIRGKAAAKSPAGKSPAPKSPTGKSPAAKRSTRGKAAVKSSAAKTPAAKTPAAKKATRGKTAVKSTAAKSPAAKRSTRGKAAVKSPAAKTPAAKKATRGKAAVKSTAAKSPAAKSPAPKSPAPKSPAKSPAPKSPAAKRLTREKAAVKSSAAKTPAAMTPAAKKATRGKAAVKSTAAKSPAPKSPAAKTPAAKSPAAKRSTREKAAAKSPAKKATRGKAAVKSTAAKSPAPKSPAAKSPAAKSPAAKRSTREKAAAKSPAAKKATRGKAAAKSPAAKRSTRGKAAVTLSPKKTEEDSENAKVLVKSITSKKTGAPKKQAASKKADTKKAEGKKKATSKALNSVSYDSPRANKKPRLSTVVEVPTPFTSAKSPAQTRTRSRRR